MDKLQKKIFDGIKNLKPKSKMFFVLENLFWWSLYILFTLFWAKAFWLLIFILFENNSSLSNNMFWPLWFFIHVFPLFWFISFLLFLSLAFIYIKHTKNAYKFWYWKIVWSSILISIILWLFFHLIWIADREDKFIRWKMPFYDNMMPRCERRWERINWWKLSWKIKKIEWNFIFLLDQNSKEWIVNKNLIKENKPDFKLLKELQIWNEIRVLWENVWDNNFEAKSILPPCNKVARRWMMKFK